MPASSGVGIVSGPIESSLRASLGGDSTSDLDQRLISASKRVLLHNIDFQKAENDSNYQLESLRSKYKPLNAARNDASSGCENHPPKLTMKPKVEMPQVNGVLPQKNKAINAGSDHNDGIPRPAVVLFPREKVQMEWKMSNKGIGMGLRNNNNNCYLNSVLQCLTYTPPLVNYLYSPDHTLTCKQAGFCMMCELQRHIKRCLDQPRIPNRECTISPQSILGKIKMIAKHLSYGRQEDAHEFLRYVVEAMQKSNLNGCHEKLDRLSKDTTVVNQIFGCYLRSQVMCLRCKERSNTYDPALDISLDIKNVNSLQRAFERFVSPETLDNDNAYNCPRCKTKVAAQKRFTVHRAPNILTVQLKRFDYHRMHGGKINRQISYPERLNLRPYMSQTQGPAVMYQLYAVLIHVGHSAGSGHYYCNVRAPNGQWFTMNDSHVSSIGLQRVLSCEAYLLFYCRQKPNMNQANLQKPLIGPTLPQGHKLGQNENKSSVIGRPSHDLGSPVTRKENIIKPSDNLKASTPTPNQPAVRPTQLVTSGPKPTSIPLPSQRDKVSFGITKPKTSQQSDGGDKPPRIVMQIKHGKVFLKNEEKEQAMQEVNGLEGSAKVKPKIVPYNDDSSNSEEEETLVIRPPVPGHSGNHKEKPSPTNGKIQGPIFDKRLNATTVVPGAYKPLDTGLEPESSSHKPRDVSPNKSSQAKFTSPLRRSVSDSLSVVTNSGPQHKVNINSTTPWYVLDQEAAISPSLASGSSNTSVNSTTDWHVTPGVENRCKPVLPEAQCNGWTVTPVKENGHSKSPTPHQEVKKETPEEESGGNKSRKELNLTIIKQPHNGGWESKLNAAHLSQQPDYIKSEGPDLHGSAKTSVSSLSTDSESANYSTSTTKLVNGHKDENEDSSGLSMNHRKKHKKHKKHKQEHDRYDEERTVNGCGVSELFNKMKKKKKKHKHKHGDREPLLSTSDSDSSRQGRKRSSSSDETDDSKKARREDGAYSQEKDYVWVEKTKTTHTIKKEAHLQNWDHHIKDSFKSRSEEEPTRQKQSWDGARSKSDTVLADLKKMSTQGYGSHVNSWDGSKSTIDQDVEKERHDERKRHWSDDYEDELDRGKAKKYKSYNNKNGGNHYGGGSNAFQRTHDARSSERDKSRTPGRYDRTDRQHYSSHHNSYNNHRDSGYRDSYRDNGHWDAGHRNSGHRDNYHGHSSYYNSFSGRDKGFYNKSNKYHRYY